MRKKFNKKLWMGGFIVFIMIFSMFGVLFFGFNQPTDDRTNQYNNYTFKYKNNGFATEIDGEEIFFPIFPLELEQIKVNDKTKQLLKEYAFVVTYDPKSELASNMATAQFKLFEERLKPFKKYVQRALTNSSGTVLPQLTCANATSSNPVILLQYGNETSITSEGNCITAKGNSAMGIYEVSDRIVYQMLGVME